MPTTTSVYNKPFFDLSHIAPSVTTKTIRSHPRPCATFVEKQLNDRSKRKNIVELYTMANYPSYGTQAMLTNWYTLTAYNLFRQDNCWPVHRCSCTILFQFSATALSRILWVSSSAFTLRCVSLSCLYNANCQPRNTVPPATKKYSCLPVWNVWVFKVYSIKWGRTRVRGGTPISVEVYVRQRVSYILPTSNYCVFYTLDSSNGCV